MIRRHRRDAAPVVDAGADQRREIAIGEVGRRLDVHLRLEQQSGDRYGPQMLSCRGGRRLRHARAGLGPEILDDDFLDVPVSFVQIADRQQRLHALGPRLADADQDAGGERHALLAGEPDGFEPHRRVLVGRSEMRAAALAQASRYALQHDALRNRHLAQRRNLIRVEHAWIDVRQEAGLLEHRAGGLREIRDRRGMAQPRELVARCGVAQLRLVAEREQRLLAARPDAGRRDRQHLVEREIGIVAPARRLRERAVVADVAAKPGQRDEDLARIRNQRAVGRVPACRRRLGQRIEIIAFAERQRRFRAQMGRQNEGHGHSLREIGATQNGGMIDIFHAAAARTGPCP